MKKIKENKKLLEILKQLNLQYILLIFEVSKTKGETKISLKQAIFRLTESRMWLQRAIDESYVD